MAVHLTDKSSRAASELDLTNVQLEQPDDDVEAGHRSTDQNSHSSAASTMYEMPVDMSKIPTQAEDGPSPSTTGGATTSSDDGDVTTTTDSAANEASQQFERSNWGLGLMQIKTVTRKKWSSNTQKGVQITTKHFYQEVDSSWTVALIIVCFFVAGMVDAASYQCYGTFISMQTGNTILVALKISDVTTNTRSLAYLKCLVSIVSYCFGSLCWNILHRFRSGVSNLKAPLHRWTLFLAFGLQGVLLTTVAILATTKAVSVEAATAGTNSTGLGHYRDLVAIAFLAFEASGQVCISRVLIVSDLPTIVISTLYHDFMSESLCTRRCWRESKTMWDFLVSQKKQIRRVFCILALFSGALVGGFTYGTLRTIMPVLWIAAGLKMCIGLAFCLWKKKTVVETVVTTRARDGSIAKIETHTGRK